MLNLHNLPRGNIFVSFAEQKGRCWSIMMLRDRFNTKSRWPRCWVGICALFSSRTQIDMTTFGNKTSSNHANLAALPRDHEWTRKTRWQLGARIRNFLNLTVFSPKQENAFSTEELPLLQKEKKWKNRNGEWSKNEGRQKERRNEI